jgi:hypothetical protein
MFSNVAMNPYGPGGSVVTAQSPRSGQPGEDPRSAAPGERGAAGTRAETVERIDPPAQPATAAALPQEDRREGTGPSPRPEAPAFGTRFTPMPLPPLLEPGGETGPRGPDGTADEDALAGPPPAFRRSVLEARRAETVASDTAPATISAPGPTSDRAEAFSPDAAPAVPAGIAEADGRASDDQPVPTAALNAEVSVGATRDTAADAAADPAIPTAGEASAAADDPLTAAIRRLVAESAEIEVPPSAEERAVAEFTSLRRMDAPYDTATVDVMR